MPNRFSLPSFAKINLHLRVLGKRGDGFHDLFTVFQTVSLLETISFEESKELTLTCDDGTVPTDDQNLIVKAANALCERFESKKARRSIWRNEFHRRVGLAVVRRTPRWL